MLPVIARCVGRVLGWRHERRRLDIQLRALGADGAAWWEPQWALRSRLAVAVAGGRREIIAERIGRRYGLSQGDVYRLLDVTENEGVVDAFAHLSRALGLTTAELIERLKLERAPSPARRPPPVE